MSNQEQISHKQMRILRLRYDELNRKSGRLVLKNDMVEYITGLRLLVDRALKNSGFDKQPVYIDRALNRRVHAGEIKNKGNVARRT
jgi:hypothetical protein